MLSDRAVPSQTEAAGFLPALQSEALYSQSSAQQRLQQAKDHSGKLLNELRLDSDAVKEGRIQTPNGSTLAQLCRK